MLEGLGHHVEEPDFRLWVLESSFNQRETVDRDMKEPVGFLEKTLQRRQDQDQRRQENIL